MAVQVIEGDLLDQQGGGKPERVLSMMVEEASAAGFNGEARIVIFKRSE